MSADRPKLTVTVSISQKVGLPNFGSADCFISLQGIVPGETTDEEIEAGLDVGKIVWSKMADRVRVKVAEIREKNGV